MELNHFKNLYTPEDIATMKVADSARMQGKNRIEEIRNYVRFLYLITYTTLHYNGIILAGQLIYNTYLLKHPPFECPKHNIFDIHTDIYRINYR